MGAFSILFYYFHKIQVVTMLFCSYYRTIKIKELPHI